MKKLTTGILAIAFVTLTTMSCKNDTKKADSDGNMQAMEMNAESEEHHDNDNAASSDRDITESTQKNGATSEIIDSYLQIKNALVIDDKDGAAEGATVMLTAFSNFDMDKLTGDTHKEYMEILESAKEQAEHIAKSPIDHQREHFETLSTDISDLIALLGTDKTLYQDYCPMKKVSWLSEIKDIKNPFYGSKMLTCGNIQKQIN